MVEYTIPLPDTIEPISASNIHSGSDLDRALAIFHVLCSDSDMMQYLVVEGLPVPKSRPRFRKNGSVYIDNKQIAAEEYLGYHLKMKFPNPLEGNLAVGCIFFRPTKQRVDVDNMLKHVMDSANKIVWHDDSQVTAQLGIIELDREHPRTVIIIGQHRSTMPRTGKTDLICERG